MDALLQACDNEIVLRLPAPDLTCLALSRPMTSSQLTPGLLCSTSPLSFFLRSPSPCRRHEAWKRAMDRSSCPEQQLLSSARSYAEFPVHLQDKSSGRSSRLHLRVGNLRVEKAKKLQAECICPGLGGMSSLLLRRGFCDEVLDVFELCGHELCDRVPTHEVMVWNVEMRPSRRCLFSTPLAMKIVDSFVNCWHIALHQGLTQPRGIRHPSLINMSLATARPEQRSTNV